MEIECHERGEGLRLCKTWAARIRRDAVVPSVPDLHSAEQWRPFGTVTRDRIPPPRMCEDADGAFCVRRSQDVERRTAFAEKGHALPPNRHVHDVVGILVLDSRDEQDAVV